MLSMLIGSVVLVAGLLGLAGAAGGIDWVAARWPRPFTPGDVHHFEASAFLIAFVSLLLIATGIALIGVGLLMS